MKSIVLAVVSVCAVAANAADVGRVIVRQQWPWSTKINVDFELSGVSASAPADISLRCYDGAAEIPAATVGAALSGARYALTEGGTYTLTLDPTVLFPSGTKTVPDFRVTVAASAASETSLEVLYKIVNLESPYDVEDVTRGALLNGTYGSIETDFAALDPSFSTGMSDVLIWTGVTNDVKYKSTHMVLRKIPANGKSFKFLKGNSKINGGNGVNVSFTNDFYIGVFEVTQAQFAKTLTHPFAATGDVGSNETNALYTAYRPVNRVPFGKSGRRSLRGVTNGVLWPEGDHTTLDSGSYFKLMQSRTGLVFDLPTEAMWEYACRGMSTKGEIYTGNYSNDAQGQKIMRAFHINGSNGAYTSAGFNNTCGRDVDLTDGPAWVGSYLPNAWGLYDMLGNLWEICLDRIGNVGPEDLVDPRGPVVSWNSTPTDRVVRGGAYNTARNQCLYFTRESVSMVEYRQVGFRVCLYPDFEVAQ